MSTSRISVTGPPRQAEEPRVGFRWILPLSSPPSTLWATRFGETDWVARASVLRPPYNPRLDGDRVWLPALEPDALRPVLDIVADEIERISAEVLAEEQNAISRQSERDEARHREEREATASFEEWWRDRQVG